MLFARLCLATFWRWLTTKISWMLIFPWNPSQVFLIVVNRHFWVAKSTEGNKRTMFVEYIEMGSGAFQSRRVWRNLSVISFNYHWERLDASKPPCSLCSVFLPCCRFHIAPGTENQIAVTPTLMSTSSNAMTRSVNTRSAINHFFYGFPLAFITFLNGFSPGVLNFFEWCF